MGACNSQRRPKLDRDRCAGERRYPCGGAPRYYSQWKPLADIAAAMNDALESLLGTLAGVGIGAYLLAVVWHGNTKQLGSMLIHEEGYLEFVGALLLLGLVDKYGPQGKVASALTSMAIIGVLIKVGMNTSLNQNLAKFASGQQSALDTLKGLFHQS